MVIPYPDILKFITTNGGSVETDQNGDTVIVPGVSTEINVQCRFEPNAEGKMIPSNDGGNLDYAWDVYAPLDQPDVPEQVDFKGFDKDGKQIASGVVKRFKRGQMNLTINL
jgi:hypothetical protein